MFKKIACIAVAFTLIFSASNALAQDEGQGMARILRSTVYGGAIGLVAGAAFMLFTDNPENHFDFLATGAGIGILGGLGYGLATSSGRIAIVEVEQDNVKLHVPTVATVHNEFTRYNRSETVATVGLVGYRF